MQLSSTRKVALVTGSGKRRVGRAIAAALAARGYAIALHYNRSAEEAAQTVRELAGQGAAAEAFQADATGLVEAIQSAVTAELGLSVYRVEIVPQGALPRTSSGKPQRRKTKKMFLDGVFPRPATPDAGA